MNNPYKGLSADELVLADHYAETGNREGLRKMRELSRQRTEAHQTVLVRGNTQLNEEE